MSFLLGIGRAISVPTTFPLEVRNYESRHHLGRRHCMNHVKKPSSQLHSSSSPPARTQPCNLSPYSAALSRGIPPPPNAFPPLLKTCASLVAATLPLLLSLHQQSLVLGYSPDAHISSSLLHAYAKHGHTDTARRLFDAMPHPNVVPWSALIACYSQAGNPNAAFSLFNRMRRHGVSPNSVTALGLISGTSCLHHLECLHASALRYGFHSDLVLANSMLNVYAKCGRADLARKMFNQMPVKDIVSWNSMMKGYSSCTGGIRDSMELFGTMRLEGLNPDRQTYGSLVSVIATNKGGGSIRLGKLVHALFVTSGIESDAHVETALVSMYLKFGRRKDAFLLFDRASDRDVVLWTAMISGLAQNDGADRALYVFCDMLRSGVMPTTTTIASALSACAQLRSFNVGASIHGFVTRRSMPLDKAARNSLLTMYAKCGLVKQCQYVFDAMQDPDLVSWNALVSGYAQNGYLGEAFLMFNRMRLVQDRLDAITVVSLLHACALRGALHHGRLVHNLIIRQELEPCISMDTSLVDMYAKCGDLKTARRCFSLMPEWDVVSWSAIIGGYGSHGMGEVALKMYEDFLHAEMEPNDVMFLSVLSACSHMGLVVRGLKIFKSMEEDFGLIPRLEHYACIIDLLCRAGRVEEALEFVRTMSPKPNADVLGILLDACRTNGYIGLAEEVAVDIVTLRPESAGNFIQLAHSYAAIGRWDGVVETRVRMRNLGMRKAPGWSFIELNGTVTTFFADHSSYPHHNEMIWVLKVMDYEMRKIRSNVFEDQFQDLT